LAVIDSDIVRPLLDMGKQEILEYAKSHNLHWREDSTNASGVYLRNRIRRKAQLLSSDEKRQLLGLRAHQIGLKKEIEQEAHTILGEGPTYSRYMLTHCDPQTAIECLRVITKGKLTRPQLGRALLAIKTSPAGAKFEAGAGVRFLFTSRNFEVELIK
jgi:tRNA(Ile)-lysidine synthase